MRKNKIHKKSFKKKLLTSTLLVLGLAFVLVGFTGFASPKTAVTQAYASEVSAYADKATSNIDGKDYPYSEQVSSIDKYILIGEDYTNSFSMGVSLTDPLSIPNKGTFPDRYLNKATDYSSSGLIYPGNEYFSYVEEKGLNEYYYCLGRTTDVNFFYDTTTTDLFDLVLKYDIEYKMAGRGHNANCLNPETTIGASLQTTTLWKNWTVNENTLDTPYYYFNFIVSYRESLAHMVNLAGRGATYMFSKTSIVERSVMPSEPITAREILTEYYEDESNIGKSDKELRNDAIRSVLGKSTLDTATVTVEWIEMTSFASYNEVSDSLSDIDATYLGCKDYVFQQVLNKLGRSLEDFNAIHKEYFYDDETKQYLLTGKRIVRIVDKDNPFTYKYDLNTNKATLSINYEPFQYNNLAITAKNNDENNLLEVSLFPTDVTTDKVKFDGTTYREYYNLIWDYDEIYQQLYNACKWLIIIEPDDISYSVSNEGNDFALFKTDESLTVRFPADAPENLFGLDITLTCIIVPDEDYSVTVSYYDVDENYSAERITTEKPVTYKLSEVINFTDKTFINSSFYADYVVAGLTVDDEIVECFKYKDVDIQWNRTDNTAVLFVEYYPATVICLKNDLNDDTNYRLLGRQSTFYVSELNFVVPVGYRIKGITVDEKFSKDVKIKFNELSPYESIVTFFCATNLEEQITLTAELSNTYLVRFDYLEQFKDSGFGILKTFEGMIDAPLVPDITKIKVGATSDNPAGTGLCKFAYYETEDGKKVYPFEKTGINVGVSTPEVYSVNFDGKGVFEISLEYSFITLKFKNADTESSGTVSEEKVVYLTNYKAWQDLYGANWSILYLNSGENQIFTSEDTHTINPENLYGFFTQLVFKEQQTDLDSICSDGLTYGQAGTDKKGVQVIAEYRTASGSDLYKWADKHQDNLGTMLISKLFVGIGEAVNDDNTVYYTYFTYLDGSATNSFAGRNDADDYDDEGDASQNTAEDIGESISDWWENSSPAKVIKVILYVLLGVLVLFFIIKFAIWLFKDRN